MDLKHLLQLAAVPLVLFSCTPEQTPPSDEKVDVRLTLENDRFWKESDEVIINGTSYSLSTDGKSSTVTVSGVPVAERYSAAYDFAGGLCEGDLLTFSLPSSSVAGSEAVRPMVACNSAPVLSLKNLTGCLRVKLDGSAVISKLVLSTASGEKIAGDASVSLRFSGTPSLEINGASAYSSVTLTSASGVSLPASFDFTLPASSYGGFRLTAFDKDGKAMTAAVIEVDKISRGETTVVELEYVQDEGESVFLNIATETDADGNRYTWTDASQLYVNGVPAALWSGSGETVAQFGPVAEADNYYVSTSANSASGSAGTTMRVSLPARQSDATALFFRNPAVGVADGLSVELKYLCAVARVDLKGSHTITSAELSAVAAGTRMAGDGVVNMTASPFAFNLNADASSSVVLSTGSLDISSGASISFVIPEGSYDEGFELTLTDANGLELVATLPAASLGRNKVTQLGEVLWEGSAGSEGDLSLKGCANCYMVHMAGDYHFRTRKVDNSSVTGIVSADWLWQSAEGLVKDVAYADGVISFKAGDGRGNALIAAFDEAGNIVWSWHVWLTDKPELHDLQNNKIYQGGGATDGFYAMDRNLGATGTTGDEALGLFYQWGRKDPFFGGTESEWVRNESSGEMEKVAEPFAEAAAVTVLNQKYAQAVWSVASCTAEIGSIDWAAAHPMTFIYAGADSNQSNWLVKSNLTQSQWYDKDASLWRPFEKTVYDPCPVGYRVPRNTTFNCLNSASGIFSDYADFVITVADGTVFRMPYQGYRSANYNDRGALLSVKGLNGSAYVWSGELNVSERAYSLSIHKPVIYGSDDDPWGNGLAVRCVKEF